MPEGELKVNMDKECKNGHKNSSEPKRAEEPPRVGEKKYRDSSLRGRKISLARENKE